MPTELSENTTYGELGKWYVKYAGAWWCNYYDTECLKGNGYPNWGGWDGTNKEVVWYIGGQDLWGMQSARARWHESNATIPCSVRSIASTKDYRFLLSTYIPTHNSVARAICNQLNQFNNYVASKAVKLLTPNPLATTSMNPTPY